MKQQDMIVVGLAAVAVVLIFKATNKSPAGLGAIQNQKAKTGNEPFRTSGDGSTGNWMNDFGWEQDKSYMALIGL